MELTEFGFKDIRLMEGERIAYAISASDSGGRPSSKYPEALLLTDSRVLHLSGSPKNRSTVMAVIEDIVSVEVTLRRRGVVAYVWAGLAFVLSLVLFATMENAAVKLGASAIVLMMGIYLVADRITEPGKPAAVFKTVSTEINWPYASDENGEDVSSFIDLLFQIKSSSSGAGARHRSFAPR